MNALKKLLTLLFLSLFLMAFYVIFIGEALYDTIMPLLFNGQVFEGETRAYYYFRFLLISYVVIFGISLSYSQKLSRLFHKQKGNQT